MASGPHSPAQLPAAGAMFATTAAAVVRTHPWLVGPTPRGGLSTRRGFPTAVDGDDPEHGRRAVRETLAGALRAPARGFAWVRQVHGAEVVHAAGRGLQGEADALVARAPAPVLLVSVADCCPVLAWDGATGVYGAAHAGWRGLDAGVLAAFVAALGRLGAAPERLRVWIGPSIGPCCFEVGREVAARFPAACVMEPPADAPAGARPRVDLRRVCAQQLAAAGIAPRHLATCPDCTSCRADLYWSFRRDRGICGRHLGYMGL